MFVQLMVVSVFIQFASANTEYTTLVNNEVFEETSEFTNTTLKLEHSSTETPTPKEVDVSVEVYLDDNNITTNKTTEKQESATEITTFSQEPLSEKTFQLTSYLTDLINEVSKDLTTKKEPISINITQGSSTTEVPHTDFKISSYLTDLLNAALVTENLTAESTTIIPKETTETLLETKNNKSVVKFTELLNDATEKSVTENFTLNSKQFVAKSTENLKEHPSFTSSELPNVIENISTSEYSENADLTTETLPKHKQVFKMQYNEVKSKLATNSNTDITVTTLNPVFTKNETNKTDFNQVTEEQTTREILETQYYSTTNPTPKKQFKIALYSSYLNNATKEPVTEDVDPTLENKGYFTHHADSDYENKLKTISTAFPFNFSSSTKSPNGYKATSTTEISQNPHLTMELSSKHSSNKDKIESSLASDSNSGTTVSVNPTLPQNTIVTYLTSVDAEPTTVKTVETKHNYTMKPVEFKTASYLTSLLKKITKKPATGYMNSTAIPSKPLSYFKEFSNDSSSELYIKSPTLTEDILTRDSQNPKSTTESIRVVNTSGKKPENDNIITTLNSPEYLTERSQHHVTTEQKADKTKTKTIQNKFVSVNENVSAETMSPNIDLATEPLPNYSFNNTKVQSTLQPSLDKNVSSESSNDVPFTELPNVIENTSALEYSKNVPEITTQQYTKIFKKKPHKIYLSVPSNDPTIEITSKKPKLLNYSQSLISLFKIENATENFSHLLINRTSPVSIPGLESTLTTPSTTKNVPILENATENVSHLLINRTSPASIPGLENTLTTPSTTKNVPILENTTKQSLKVLPFLNSLLKNTANGLDTESTSSQYTEIFKNYPSEVANYKKTTDGINSNPTQSTTNNFHINCTKQNLQKNHTNLEIETEKQAPGLIYNYKNRMNPKRNYVNQSETTTKNNLSISHPKNLTTERSVADIVTNSTTEKNMTPSQPETSYSTTVRLNLISKISPRNNNSDASGTDKIFIIWHFPLTIVLLISFLK